MVIGTGLIAVNSGRIAGDQRVVWREAYAMAELPPAVKVWGWSDNYWGGANSCDYSSFVGQSGGDEMNHCMCDDMIDEIVTIKWYQYVTCDT